MTYKLQATLLGISFLLIQTVNAQTTNSTKQLPEVTVSASATETRASDLEEEQAVGANQQPEWTTQRRFSTTRIYVMEPWQVEFEQWWKGKFLRTGKTEHLFQSEIGIGLPHRLQLDLYENVERTKTGSFRHKGNQVEVRYALAEWGKILLNPTLYGEWKFNNHDPDAYEVKLLLGDEIAPRWHWGANFAYEQEVGGSRESELAVSQGVGYTLVDEKLSVGAEIQVERASAPNLHGKPEWEVLFGPSLQWRPTSRVHLDLVPLAGLTHDSPRVEAFIIIGIDLGRKSESHYAPASLRSK